MVSGFVNLRGERSCHLFGDFRSEPHIPVYDDYLRGLGGEPDAALPAE
jgi:hypothetical protein